MAVSQAVRQLRLPPLPSIRDVVRLYKLRAMKQLSQNFLMEERITDKIVRAAGNIEGGYICEVGPGPGGITRSIIRKFPNSLTVVEMDKRFIPTLEMLGEATSGHINFNIIMNDILKTDLSTLFPDAPKQNFDSPPPNIHLIGNLPFNVSTILIIRWLEAISTHSGAWEYGRTRMVLTFQKEVAERIVAPISSKQRCRLSVMCQNWCKVDHKFTISGSAFVPKPDVDVGVVVFTPLKRPLISLNFKLIEKVLRNTFHMRQKYSIRGIKNLFPEEMREELGQRMYQVADLDPQIRPFQISNLEFGRLCHAYADIIKEYPEIEHYNFRGPKKVISSSENDEKVIKLDKH